MTSEKNTKNNQRKISTKNSSERTRRTTSERRRRTTSERRRSTREGSERERKTVRERTGRSTVSTREKGSRKSSTSSRQSTRNTRTKNGSRRIETSNKWKKKKQKRRLTITGIIVAILLVVVGIFQFMDYEKELGFREKGIAQFQKGQYKEAQEYFEEALEHTNIFGGTVTQDVRYYLAESYFMDEQYDKALNLYQQISRKEKNKGYAECYIGAAYARLGDTEKAKAQFEKGISLGNEEGYHYLSRMYYELGDYDKAIENELSYMEKREPDGTSYMVLAKSYCKAGQYKKALQAIADGIELDDSQKQALLFEEIVIYEQKLDFDTAYKKCLTYVANYPEDETAKQELEFLETR